MSVSVCRIRMLSAAESAPCEGQISSSVSDDACPAMRAQRRLELARHVLQVAAHELDVVHLRIGQFAQPVAHAKHHDVEAAAAAVEGVSRIEQRLQDLPVGHHVDGAVDVELLQPEAEGRNSGSVVKLATTRSEKSGGGDVSSDSLSMTCRGTRSRSTSRLPGVHAAASRSTIREAGPVRREWRRERRWGVSFHACAGPAGAPTSMNCVRLLAPERTQEPFARLLD
jgi:hypothetical protein